MKKAILTIALLASAAAQAQTVTGSSSAQQTAQSQAAAIAGQTFNANPAHTTETVLNVSAPIAGAYGAGGSQYNCYGTKWQVGAAGPGASLYAGGGSGLLDCQQGWVSNDFARQQVVEPTQALKDQDAQIAFNVRCMVSAEIYDAIQATAEMTGGRRCMVKPKDYKPTQDVAIAPDGTKTRVVADTTSKVAGN